MRPLSFFIGETVRRHSHNLIPTQKANCLLFNAKTTFSPVSGINRLQTSSVTGESPSHVEYSKSRDLSFPTFCLICVLNIWFML